MSSKTKIVVLHMKEIVYTAIFAVLAIVLIILLIFMFRPKSRETSAEADKYVPGVYTSTVTLNSIRFSNLDETVTTMYPLIQPTIENIAEQVYEKQSLDNIEYSEEYPYTSQILTSAIDEALEKATTAE